MGGGELRVLRESRVKILLMTAILLVFTLFGVLLVEFGPRWLLWLHWPIALFFGVCTLLSAVLLLPNSSCLQIGPEGFTVRYFFRPHSCRWTEIDTFRVESIAGHKRVLFNYSPQYRGAIGPRWLGATITGGILPSLYGMSAEELADSLNQCRGK